MNGHWLTRVGGGAIACPLSIVLHELGHFGAYVALRLPDPVLHFASAGWTGASEFKRLWRSADLEAAAAIAQPWQVAVGTAAGPVVTYLTVIACVLAVRRWGPGPGALVFGLGLAAPLRWLIGIPVLYLNLRGNRTTSNTDEGWVAAITGIPETLLFLLGLACLLLACWFLVKAIPRNQRVGVVVPTLAGIVLGGVVWVSWLGPRILP